MRVAIIAAMVGELKPLVAGWEKLPSQSKTIYRWTRNLNGVEWVAVCAGMGAEAARRAFAAAEMVGKIDAVVSYGWAGALSESARAGEVMGPASVVDAQTGEVFQMTAGEKNIRLVTTARVADAAEKQRLAATYRAQAVDMEAATVARLAEMRGIPIFCVKGISDEFGANLPDLNPFIDKSGQMRMAGLIGYIALRPRYWLTLIHLGNSSGVAARAMRDRILGAEFLNSMDGENAG